MKTSPLNRLTLTPEALAALRSRGVQTIESLSDLLHGSSDSRASVAKLLNLRPPDLEALMLEVDGRVPATVVQRRIGRLGARPSKPPT